MTRTRPHTRWWRLVCWVFAIWTIAAATMAIAGLLTTPKRADLALVLGNTVTRGNRPMPRLEARLEAARALYANGGCATIMVSGGIDPHDHRNEAAGMKQWLVDHGVPSQEIEEDPYGNDTRASARHAEAWLAAHDKRSVVVVSQFYHLPRTRLALHQAGAVDAGGTYPRRWFLRDIYSSYREALGYPAYWLQLDGALRRRHADIKASS